MKKDIFLEDGGIKQTIENVSKRLIGRYIAVFFMVIMMNLVMGYFMGYGEKDLTFRLKQFLLIFILLLPCYIFIIRKVIKTKKCINSFEKTSIYKVLNKKFKFKNESEFEAFDKDVTREVKENVLFNCKRTKFLFTESYIINCDLPINECFNVNDANKLLLVEYNPLNVMDYVIKSRYRIKGGHRIALYFEDYVQIIFSPTKKYGQELCDKIASTYKVLNGVNINLSRFYEKDRERFVKSCKDEIQKIYYKKEMPQ